VLEALGKDPILTLQVVEKRREEKRPKGGIS